jgi:mannose-6-phosphate isomerase-like protein (cupin superfamily)
MRALVGSRYFVVEHFALSTQHTFDAGQTTKSSVQIMVVINGAGVLECEGSEAVTFSRGDAVVVPPGYPRFIVHTRDGIEFLKSYVPGVRVPEPETSLS